MYHTVNKNFFKDFQNVKTATKSVNLLAIYTNNMIKLTNFQKETLNKFFAVLLFSASLLSSGNGIYFDIWYLDTYTSSTLLNS